MSLSNENRRRYARHLVLPEIGEAGQEKLLQASVLVVGAGGLGSVAAGYLAAMGVGTIGIVDGDRVELSNLQRQILFETADIGQHKVKAAANRLEEINTGISIKTYTEHLNEANADPLLRGYQLIIDATDNFPTRIILHDACQRAKKTLISAAISAFAATMTTYPFSENKTFPCLHCFMPELPEREISCEQEGIIGALAGIMGSMQALEAVKEILAIGHSLAGRMVRFDALNHEWKTSELSRDPACNYCNIPS